MRDIYIPSRRPDDYSVPTKTGKLAHLRIGNDSGRPPVLVSLDIAPEFYERMRSRTTEGSHLDELLSKGMVMSCGEFGTRKKTVKVVCEKEDTAIILDAAKAMCPEAFTDIERSIAPLDFSQ